MPAEFIAWCPCTVLCMGAPPKHEALLASCSKQRDVFLHLSTIDHLWFMLKFNTKDPVMNEDLHRMVIRSRVCVGFILCYGKWIVIWVKGSSFLALTRMGLVSLVTKI